jgi:hypothetical protein
MRSTSGRLRFWVLGPELDHRVCVGYRPRACASGQSPLPPASCRRAEARPVPGPELQAGFSATAPFVAGRPRNRDVFGPGSRAELEVSRTLAPRERRRRVGAEHLPAQKRRPHSTDKSARSPVARADFAACWAPNGKLSAMSKLTPKSHPSTANSTDPVRCFAVDQKM